MKPLIGTKKDIPEIMGLISKCIVDMQGKGIDQWGDFYPTEQVIRDDIEKEHLYLFEIESQLIGIVTINEYQDEEWSQVQWATHDSRPLIAHRLTISPRFQRQGYGRMLMEWVESYAKSHGYSSIRLDAYQGNPAALRLYENHEYTKTGEVLFPNRSLPFNCYEKVLRDDVLETDNQWRVIYQTTDPCEELVEVLKNQKFIVQIFCDSQCKERYMPGLQHGDLFVDLIYYVAVHKDQWHDALHVLQQWQQQDKREHLCFKISTFTKALKALFFTLAFLFIFCLLLYSNFSAETDASSYIPTLIGSAVLVWTVIFLFLIFRKPTSPNEQRNFTKPN